MKRILVLLILLLPIISHAQKQWNTWYFGDLRGLDFNSGTPTPILTGKLTTAEGSAGIADKNTGAVLFYTDGKKVWDRTNTVMPNGTGLGGDGSSTQSALIIPKPGDSTLYYIFTVDDQAGLYGGSGGLNYSIVDITLNGGLGDVTIKDKLLLTPATEKLCATMACNGTDVWVAVHQWNTDAFYTYLVTDTGISLPVISHTGMVHHDVGSKNNGEAAGYMKISPDGQKLVVALGDKINAIQIFDFDLGTGMVSNPLTDAYPFVNDGDEPYGVSFSPDNSKLYVSHLSIPGTNEIYQYNLLAGDSAAIIASRVSVAASQNYAWAGLQNGPDGKMYIAKIPLIFSHGNDSLDVISNPNALGAACHYNFNGLYLGATGSVENPLGLPNLIETSFTSYSGSLSYTNCSGSKMLSFPVSTFRGHVSAQWDFNDTASGAANTSALQHPAHQFSSPGIYYVQLILTNTCQSDTFIKPVTIDSIPSVDVEPKSPSYCFGTGAHLVATGGDTYTWSPSTGLSATTGSHVIANPPSTTTYTVTATNAAGCTGTAADKVTIFPAPTVGYNYTNTGLTVNYTSDSATGGITTYTWDFGDSTGIAHGATTTHTYSKAGNYYSCLTVYNNSNCSYTRCQYVDLTATGVHDISVEVNFQLYPNPVSEQLTVSSEQLTVSSIEITNVLAQTLITQHPSPNSKQTVIDVSELPTGVYLMVVKNKGGVGVKKFVKE